MQNYGPIVFGMAMALTAFLGVCLNGHPTAVNLLSTYGGWLQDYYLLLAFLGFSITTAICLFFGLHKVFSERLRALSDMLWVGSSLIALCLTGVTLAYNGAEPVARINAASRMDARYYAGNEARYLKYRWCERFPVKIDNRQSLYIDTEFDVVNYPQIVKYCDFLDHVIARVEILDEHSDMDIYNNEILGFEIVEQNFKTLRTDHLPVAVMFRELYRELIPTIQRHDVEVRNLANLAQKRIVFYTLGILRRLAIIMFAIAGALRFLRTIFDFQQAKHTKKTA